jgi:hypothetical protein
VSDDRADRDPKIAAYSIMRNEQRNIFEWAESAREADLLVLVDTGSTDSSVSFARSLKTHTVGGPKVAVCEVAIVPFRFDAGFNAALAHVPADVDICIPLHLDERLQPGWREELTRVWRLGADRFTFWYEWSEHLTFQHDRIHTRSGWRWEFPAHENLTGAGARMDTEVRIVQQRDLTKDRGQDSSLIRLGYEENPENPRTVYYWGRQCFYENDWHNGRTVLLKYLKLPDANFDQERAEACRFIAKMVYPDQAESWLLRAVSECPRRREPWLDLATHYYSQRLWTSSAGASDRALRITQQDNTNSFHLESQSWDDGQVRELRDKALAHAAATEAT